MSRKHRSARPSDPVDIARRRAAEREKERAVARDPAQWGVAAPALKLAANRDVGVRVGADGRVVQARRQDVFDLLLGRGKLSASAHGAVRRLQEDVAILHRAVAGGGDYAPRVDRSRRPETFSEQRRRAAERVEAALGLAGPVSARLLGAVCEADAVLGRPADWRALVARETGETLPDAQSAVLRAACENLAAAYGLVDRDRTRR
jgi:hypothetical protein